MINNSWLKNFLNYLIFYPCNFKIFMLNLVVQLGVRTMAECYVTGKKTVFGNKRSHALNATRRMWKANLQTVRIKDENGNIVKVKISARALKKNNLERV